MTDTNEKIMPTLTFDKTAERHLPSPVPRMDWIAIAAKLYDNPGQWARIDEPLHTVSSRTKASQIKAGTAPGFRDGTWDARVVPLEDMPTRCHMWIMCTHPDRAES